MWVLTRHDGQTGYRGDDITATGVGGNPAKMGIKAPQDVAVHREGIDRQIQKALRERKIR